MCSFGEACHERSGEAEMAKRNVSLSADFDRWQATSARGADGDRGGNHMMQMDSI